MTEQNEIQRAEEAVTAVQDASEKEGKRYSKGLKEITVFTEDMGDAAVDVADAVTKGLRRFRKASTESSKKRKDGALLDLLPNLGKGLSTTMDAAKDVPIEIGDAFAGKTPRRAIRRVSKSLSSILRGFTK